MIKKKLKLYLIDRKSLFIPTLEHVTYLLEYDNISTKIY